MEIEWESNKFINKSFLYGFNAKNETNSSPFYSFWCSLYLELLARAALAKIHPVLLADPRDGKSVLYTFGVSMDTPKSIPANTLYKRCHELILNFDKKALTFSLILSQARNKELHSGEAGFEILEQKDSLWRLEQYRVTKIFCDFLKIGITEFFIEKEALVSQNH